MQGLFKDGTNVGGHFQHKISWGSHQFGLLAVENGGLEKPGWESFISKELALAVCVCPFCGGLCVSCITCSSGEGGLSCHLLMIPSGHSAPR